MDPEKEPDLYPLDPRDKRAAVKGEARRAEDADVLCAFLGMYVDRDLRQEGLSRAVIKDTMQTVRDHGLKAPYTTHLIQSVCNTHVFIPNDFKTLFPLIMTDMQYTVWESKMRQLTGAQAAENLALGVRDPLRTITADTLLGQADFGANAAQAMICQAGLQQVKQLALCAMKTVPEADKHRQPFVLIEQEANEPFMKFLDRLNEALEKQIDNEKAREYIFKQLAIENANPDCQKVL
ncbi:hypothetical protein AAES_141002 [Amazona aestiva]|uniref:Retroviral nucleocapsid Gag protein p24 C-terminal domain-containing protein n=1 Tax=Amazona aestiva TaxID=12930 RepID=A0A0Q3T634_AMAAE|nr:hypothetical protein AAES_141002 [Amazona aestiva]